MEENKKQSISADVKMDGKSKALFLILVLLVLGSAVFTYYKYIVKRDYVIQAATDCDPEFEACFVWECDPESMVEGEACTGVPDNDIWYYKLIERKAYNIPDCPASPAGGDPNDEDCNALVCGEDEPDCQEILCDSENVPEWEYCNNPEQYLIDNPPEECEEDDEECLAEEDCEEGDEECLADENEECAPDDEECLSAQEEECTSDDPAECEEAPADEAEDDTSENSSLEESESGEQEDGAINIPPPGVEPM